MVPVIVVNVDYFNRLLAADNPAEVALQLFLSGGWALFVIVLLYGVVRLWLDARKEQYLATRKKVLLAIDVPRDTEQTPKAVESIFSALSGSYSNMDWIEAYWKVEQQPVYSFEIVSHEGYVQFYVQTWVKYRDLVEAAIYAQYPDAEITEVEDYTKNAPAHFPAPPWKLFGSEFKLMNRSYYPIRTYPEFEDKVSGELKDPIGNLLESMAKLRPGERLWLQILVAPMAYDSWRKHGDHEVKKIMRRHETRRKEAFREELGKLPGSLLDAALMRESGEAPAEKKDVSIALHLTPSERLIIEGIHKKIAKVPFHVKIRYLYIAREEVFAKSRTASMVKGSFAQFTILDQNGFLQFVNVTTKTDYPWQTKKYWEYLSLFMLRTLTTRQNSLLHAYRHRDMHIGAPHSVLNTEELATIYHFPVVQVKAPLVKKTLSKRAEPPVALPISEASFGLWGAPTRSERSPVPSVGAKKAQPPREFAQPLSESQPMPTAEPVPPGDIPFI